MKARLPTKIKGPIFSSHAVVLVLLTSVALSASAQGTFQNLDFESAVIPATTPTGFGQDVSIAAGLPGWRGFINGTEVSTILHNNFNLGSPAISVLGPQWGAQNGIIEGNYAAVLTGVRLVSASDAAISQTGAIPNDSKSLLFKATPGVGQLQVSFRGNQIPIIPLSRTAAYNIYGGDISSLAGQSGDLNFLAMPPAVGAQLGLNIWYVDSIHFSTQVIPEPSTFALLAAGAAVFGAALNRRRK